MIGLFEFLADLARMPLRAAQAIGGGLALSCNRDEDCSLCQPTASPKQSTQTPGEDRPGARGMSPPAAAPCAPGHSSLVIAAAIGLREYAALPQCEAPIYWRAISDQLDPK